MNNNNNNKINNNNLSRLIEDYNYIQAALMSDSYAHIEIKNILISIYKLHKVNGCMFHDCPTYHVY